jgi:hypothetical protein
MDNTQENGLIEIMDSIKNNIIEYTESDSRFTLEDNDKILHLMLMPSSSSNVDDILAKKCECLKNEISDIFTRIDSPYSTYPTFEDMNTYTKYKMVEALSSALNGIKYVLDEVHPYVKPEEEIPDNVEPGDKLPEDEPEDNTIPEDTIPDDEGMIPDNEV